MRKTLGGLLFAAGLAGLVVAAVTGVKRGTEIAALRRSIAARVAERSATRDQLAQKRVQAEALRKSKEEMPDSLWQAERGEVFRLQQANDRAVRELQAQEKGQTRWITLDEIKLSRKEREMALRAGAAAGGGLLACALGWALARRRLGA